MQIRPNSLYIWIVILICLESPTNTTDVTALLSRSILCFQTANANSCCQRSFYDIKQPNTLCNVGGSSHQKPESKKNKQEVLGNEVVVLPRIDPVQVGFSRQVAFGDKNYTMKTLSLKPPIFEIRDFLSSNECDVIISAAKAIGLETSETVWQEYEEVLENGNLYPIFQKLDVDKDSGLDHFELAQGIQGIKDIHMEKEDIKEMFDHFGLNIFDDGKISFSEFEVLISPDQFKQLQSYLSSLEDRKSHVKNRKSFSAFLEPSVNTEHIGLFEELYDRISTLTKLPIEMIRSSEALQVIKYEVSGHYNAHHDSESNEYAPCCHLTRDISEICRPCRYATMFYYLNEPIEGGGTAFPFSDNDTYDDVRTNREDKHRLNLSMHCDKANLVYKPRKGTALFWYNHVIDVETGWVGKLDERSYHGGCEVIRGVKWAANNWLNANSDREKDLEVWRNFGESL